MPSGTVPPAGSSINAANVVRITNGNKGYYFSLSFQLLKQLSKGFSAAVAYTKSIVENLFDGGGDQPLSAWQSTFTLNPNIPRLGNAGFAVPDHVIAILSYRREYLKHLGTTISIFYDGSIQDRFSYVYGADFNRDGFNGNDLIYVPKDPSEINFVDLPASSATGGVAYSAAQQSTLFFQYIEQDKYLRKRKGQYAERNAARLPWRNQFDFKVIQDVFMNIGRNRNTLQFTIDIFNVGNLINSDWGTLKTVNASSILVPVNATNTSNVNVTINGTATALPAYQPGGTTRPHFRLQTDRNRIVTETFRDNVSIASTYYMQFGVRYLFGN